MTFTFGKHYGESVEFVVLADPSYIGWLLREPYPKRQMRVVKEEVQRLLTLFDAKPFTYKCSGDDCICPATRVWFSRRRAQAPEWWCEACDPYQTGTPPGKLRMFRTYADALGY